MRDLLDTEPEQPNPDADNRIPYFQPPVNEPNPQESPTDGNR